MNKKILVHYGPFLVGECDVCFSCSLEENDEFLHVVYENFVPDKGFIQYFNPGIKDKKIDGINIQGSFYIIEKESRNILDIFSGEKMLKILSDGYKQWIEENKEKSNIILN